MGRLLISAALLLYCCIGLECNTIEYGWRSAVQSPADNPYADRRWLTTIPQNTAVVVGNRASLTCISNSSNNLTWAFIPVGGEGKDYVIIVNSCTINPAFSADYLVENVTQGACDLVIRSAERKHAGTYVCHQQTGVDHNFNSRVVVLDSDPVCSMNVSETDIFEFEFVLFRCQVNYTDNVSPLLMVWFDQDGIIVEPHTNITTPGRTESSYQIQARLFTLPPHLCKCYFGTPNFLPWHANNTPIYDYNYRTPPSEVKNMLMVPVNITAPAGAIVNMTCRRRSQNIMWIFVAAEDPTPFGVTSNCAIIFAAIGKGYDVDRELYACHLIIGPLIPAHAGKYTCQDAMSPEEPNFAYLTVTT